MPVRVCGGGASPQAPSQPVCGPAPALSHSRPEISSPGRPPKPPAAELPPSLPLYFPPVGRWLPHRPPGSERVAGRPKHRWSRLLSMRLGVPRNRRGREEPTLTVEVNMGIFPLGAIGVSYGHTPPAGIVCALQTPPPERPQPKQPANDPPTEGRSAASWRSGGSGSCSCRSERCGPSRSSAPGADPRRGRRGPRPPAVTRAFRRQSGAAPLRTREDRPRQCGGGWAAGRPFSMQGFQPSQ